MVKISSISETVQNFNIDIKINIGLVFAIILFVLALIVFFRNKFSKKTVVVKANIDIILKEIENIEELVAYRYIVQRVIEVSEDEIKKYNNESKSEPKKNRMLLIFKTVLLCILVIPIFIFIWKKIRGSKKYHFYYKAVYEIGCDKLTEIESKISNNKLIIEIPSIKIIKSAIYDEECDMLDSKDYDKLIDRNTIIHFCNIDMDNNKERILNSYKKYGLENIEATFKYIFEKVIKEDKLILEVIMK